VAQNFSTGIYFIEKKNCSQESSRLFLYNMPELRELQKYKDLIKCLRYQNKLLYFIQKSSSGQKTILQHTNLVLIQLISIIIHQPWADYWHFSSSSSSSVLSGVLLTSIPLGHFAASSFFSFPLLHSGNTHFLSLLTHSLRSLGGMERDEEMVTE